MAENIVKHAATGANDLLLKVEGQQQGWIKGDVKRKGKEDLIEVHNFSWGATSPRDAATGHPSGKRFFHPLKVTVSYTDKSIPLLFQALSNNENLKKVELDLWATGAAGTSLGAGTSEKVVTFHLENASVSQGEIETHLDGTLAVNFSFTFQKVEIVHVKGGITFVDDWINQ